MSEIDKLIKRKTGDDPELQKYYREESEKLDIAVALVLLREEEGLTQRQLAEKVGKPQSTIARIENGTMNVSFRVLNEIAEALGKKLEVRFV